MAGGYMHYSNSTKKHLSYIIVLHMMDRCNINNYGIKCTLLVMR